MKAAICMTSEILASVISWCLLSTRAVGGTLLDCHEAPPWIGVANVADPQIKLTSAILLLFAGSLLLLAIGYVVDSLRTDSSPAGST